MLIAKTHLDSNRCTNCESRSKSSIKRFSDKWPIQVWSIWHSRCELTYAECVKLGITGLVGRGTQLYTVTAKHTLTINFTPHSLVFADSVSFCFFCSEILMFLVVTKINPQMAVCWIILSDWCTWSLCESVVLLLNVH